MKKKHPQTLGEWAAAIVGVTLGGMTVLVFFLMLLYVIKEMLELIFG